MSLQPPAKRSEKLAEVESSIEDAMQKWLDNAQKSNDARDRIALANGISRGVFGSLHLGASHSTNIDDEADTGFTEQEDFKRAA